MPRPTQRNAQTLNAYQDYLLSKVSKVRILGERHERELKDVFVDLSIVEQGEPDQHSEFLVLMDTITRRRMNPFQAQPQDVPFGDTERRARDAKRRLRPEELSVWYKSDCQGWAGLRQDDPAQISLAASTGERGTTRRLARTQDDLKTSLR
jgi:hypothetical protein